MHPFFVRDYKLGAKRFNIEAIIRNIALLREYDMKSKGVNNASATEGELLREMVFKMMH